MSTFNVVNLLETGNGYYKGITKEGLSNLPPGTSTDYYTRDGVKYVDVQFDHRYECFPTEHDVPSNHKTYTYIIVEEEIG